MNRNVFFPLWLAVATLASHPCRAEENAVPATTAALAVVATVGGEPVTADEILLLMNKRKAEIFSLFREQHGMEDHTGYWNDRTDVSPSPITRLRETVMADIKEMKAILQMAKEKGLIEDISHATFLRDLEKENARRKEMVSSGGVIYGPRQYSIPVYHSIRYRDTAHRLKQVLQAEASRVLTDKDVEAYRRGNPGQFDKGTAEQNREAILKHLRNEWAEAAMRAIAGKAEVKVLDLAAFESIRPRTDPQN